MRSLSPTSRKPVLVLVLVLTLVSAATVGEPRPGIDWPQFRGIHATGVIDEGKAPTAWDVPAGTNVLWKTAVPGMSHAAPIVWGDRVYIVTADGGRDASLRIGLYGDIQPVDEKFPHKWQVLCLDKKTGSILWTRTAHEGVPIIKRHTKATHANATPATDGKHVVAFFGAEGLYCYDADGTLKWKKDFGPIDSGFFMVPAAQWGFAASPILVDGRVVVQVDVQKDSFVAMFDVADGREIWRTRRDDVPSWSTPTLSRAGGRTQIVCNGFREIAGYDFATGKNLWTLDGGGDIPVPTPIVAHDLIFLASAHGPRAPVGAVRPSASGDLELPDEDGGNRHIAWWKDRIGVYMQTPIVVGDFLYGCRDNGVLICWHARSGQEVYKQRLGTGSTGFTASPIAVGGVLYFTSEEGDVHVVKAGDTFEKIAVNPLGEPCMATPAASEGVLYFRTRGHVVAIGEK